MPSARRLFWASGILILPRVAGAQSPPAVASTSGTEQHAMRLSWVRSAAAASCPDAGHVEADVEQRLGWSPFIHSSAASESIEASVTRANDVWHADIELRAADGSSLGSRAVESPAPTCASVTAAAGLAIALMIEPLLPPKPETTPPPVAATPKTGGTAASSTEAKSAAAPTPSSSSSSSSSPNEEGASAQASTRGNLALGAVAVVGILPHAAVGATVTGSAQLVGRLFGTVSASLLPEQHLRQDNADVGFGLTLGAIGPCYRIPIQSNWSLSSCASLLLGSLQITVQSPEPLTPGARLWWGASTGLRLAWSSGPFETALGIDALAHVTRHSYLIDHAEAPNSTSFFVEPAVALLGSLVAGVRY